MAVIYFDIETRPAPEEERQRILEELTAEGFTPPGNVKKAETIAAKQREWEQGLEAKADEKWRRTSLDASDGGQILCIGYAITDITDETNDALASNGFLLSDVLGFHPETKKFMDDSVAIDTWWQICGLLSAHERLLYVGYNILDFDLPFIWRRSVVNEIKPQAWPSMARFRTEPVYDIMQIWGNWRNNIKLDKLCRLLSIPSPKDGIDGSQVWQAVCDGREQEVADYCRRDVDVLIKLHDRLRFIDRKPVMLP